MHEALARSKFERDAALLTERLVAVQGLTVHELGFPIVDITIVHTNAIRLRLLCNDWDDQPPSITLLNPDGSPWSARLPGGVFNAGAHPGTGRPFICMRGSREYHTHPSHRNDAWPNYRGQNGMNLVGLLMQLCDVWRSTMQ